MASDSKNNYSSYSEAITFIWFLTILFIVLKLNGKIAWEWVWVLSPIIILIIIVVAIIIIMAIYFAIKERNTNGK